MTVNFSNIAVLGAGAMGRGIAQIAAQAGSRVLLLDKADGAADHEPRVRRGREKVGAAAGGTDLDIDVPEFIPKR